MSGASPVLVGTSTERVDRMVGKFETGPLASLMARQFHIACTRGVAALGTGAAHE